MFLEWAFRRLPFGRFHSEYFDHKDEDLGSFGRSNCRYKLIGEDRPGEMGLVCRSFALTRMSVLGVYVSSYSIMTV